jgi:hypothetical protein
MPNTPDWYDKVDMEDVKVLDGRIKEIPKYKNCLNPDYYKKTLREYLKNKYNVTDEDITEMMSYKITTK